MEFSSESHFCCLTDGKTANSSSSSSSFFLNSVVWCRKVFTFAFTPKFGNSLEQKILKGFSKYPVHHNCLKGWLKCTLSDFTSTFQSSKFSDEACRGLRFQTRTFDHPISLWFLVCFNWTFQFPSEISLLLPKAVGISTYRIHLLSLHYVSRALHRSHMKVGELPSTQEHVKVIFTVAHRDLNMKSLPRAHVFTDLFLGWWHWETCGTPPLETGFY